MNKGLSLLDFVYLNQETDYLSTELKNLIKIYGSLEYNIGKHIRLMNKIPEIDKRFGGTQWLNSRPFKLLVEKILEIESRIDKYILLMYDTEVDLPDTVFNYVRLQDLINYYKGKSVGVKDPLKSLENDRKKLTTHYHSDDALWAIADDLRARVDDGKFKSYREAYRWAEKNILHKGKYVAWHKYERAFYKARSEGKV